MKERMVVYEIGVLKHFAPWDISCSEGIETILDKNFLIFFGQSIYINLG